MHWLVVSVALSLVLTVLVNVGLRLFPGAGRRLGRALAALAAPSTDEGRQDGRPVRVLVPWKAMVVGSVILTILVNLALRVV